ncbi:ABC transporter substrate-binding protein [Candidatus Roseilinea sp. NK_OTU-006]|jgi:multiple sugar transport system substrate-binding protein|uniref:ABC transporter substrate-binding protein n=1 Tax=Candidatus Roseilinea sp. NK_OTU-006 TaxID=2704250 RepID=UPI00145D7420|nr:extracellular solute-binding protein [Candidatus Roseilinea sp. NK_OTU-006]
MSDQHLTRTNKRIAAALATFAALSLLVAACAPAAPAAPAQPAAPAEQPTAPAAPAAPAQSTAPAEQPAGEVKDFVTWYQYDETNVDPKSDERVGNEYLRKTIPLFNEAFKGKWRWVNQPQPFDKMATNLVAAVQSGGEVPDLMQSGDADLVPFIKNGAVQDLTDWVKAQPWFSDLDPSAVASCTGPDGRIYCVPVAMTPQVVFVWRDHFPDGYPKTPEAFKQAAEALKAKGVYAITYFGSTAFDGEGTTRFTNTLIKSFGGTFDDGQGKMKLDTPENVAAITFLREIIAAGYVHPRTWEGTTTPFIEEDPMKTAEAASFPTGIFGYRYVNPLKAPNGKEYNKGNGEDMLDAITAGDVFIAPFFAPEGRKPGCGTGVSGFVIPTGAKNVEAAKDYINWIMTKEQNPDWVLGPGGGFPALRSMLPEIEARAPIAKAFYEQAAAAVAASECRPWYGSLERRQEAQKIIQSTIYKLTKEDPTADISATLKAAEEEYNKGN